MAGAQLIVLSEHVDYWNHLGWRDPYSSRQYSQRQSQYASRFGLEGPYTPEIVVDGASEFVGSDRARGESAISGALVAKKISMSVSGVSLDANGFLRAHLDTATLPSSLAQADVVFVVAINHARSRVAGGENQGRTLDHVAVVSRMLQVGTISPGQRFGREVGLQVDSGVKLSDLRLIAFIQEPNQGKILGATLMLPDSTK